MNIAIFGASGMLGSEVVRVAKEHGHTVTALSHYSCPIEKIEVVAWTFNEAKPDVLINCAGALPGSQPQKMLLTNALGPHNLAALGIRLVHMSTDCVYSGKGPVRRFLKSEEDLPNPVDLYGKSKFAGEPQGDHVLVVRGSFIGEKRGLLGWLLRSRGAIDAWMHAYWNGTTASQMAKALVDLAEGDKTGLIHAAAPEYVTKAWILEYLAEELNLRVSFNLVLQPEIWRVLEPDYMLPSVKEALDEWVISYTNIPADI